MNRLLNNHSSVAFNILSFIPTDVGLASEKKSKIRAGDLWSSRHGMTLLSERGCQTNVHASNTDETQGLEHLQNGWLDNNPNIILPLCKVSLQYDRLVCLTVICPSFTDVLPTAGSIYDGWSVSVATVETILCRAGGKHIRVIWPTATVWWNQAIGETRDKSRRTSLQHCSDVFVADMQKSHLKLPNIW